MPALVESVSPFELVRGVGLALLSLLVAGFGFYLGIYLVAASLVLLALVLGAGGVKPLGDTPIYHIALGSVLEMCAISLVVTGGVGIVPLVFAVLGVGLLLYSGRNAIERSVWEPVS